MRSLPGVTVFSPADKVEAAAVAKAAVACPGTCYIRLGRGGEPVVRDNIENFQVGKAIPVRKGSRVAIFSTGDIYKEVTLAAELLSQSGIEPTIYTFPTVMPMDAQTVVECAREHELIVTCEEHNIQGGLGTAVAELLAEQSGSKARLLRIGMENAYCSVVGTQEHLRKIFGMNGEEIARRIKEELK